MFDAAGGFETFMRDMCVIVTSDHGHSEILPDRAAAVIELQTVFADFRQADLGRSWRAGDEIMICPNMRAAQIYLREPAATVERVAQTALLDPRVDLVMWRAAAGDGGESAYVVTGPRGRLVFWREASGRAPAGDRPGGSGVDPFGTRWCWRGDLETLQIERDGPVVASTEYPNAFERIANVLDARSSGDVWLTAQPGCEFDVRGGHAHVGGGSHGALHALDSLCPVIVAGAPRRLPRAFRSVDVAPLCMEALGLPLRYQVGDARVAGSGRNPAYER
jgi:hypothetical protein